MTDDDIRRHIDLMRAIDKPTVHLPIATVERLMEKTWRGRGYNNLSHGHTRFRKNTPTYSSYRSMVNRCTNENVERFKHYGGRGIYVCDRWMGDKGFENFLSDMGEKPDGMSLDRLDTSKGYCRENCRWATVEQQMNNTTRNRFVEYKGERKTISEWARAVGMKTSTLGERIRKGWDLDRAFGQYVRPWNR